MRVLAQMNFLKDKILYRPKEFLLKLMKLLLLI